MSSTYTALIESHGDCWIGWVKELSGVNSQGNTRAELVENLRSALQEALEMNGQDAEAAVSGEYEEVSLIV